MKKAHEKKETDENFEEKRLTMPLMDSDKKPISAYDSESDGTFRLAILVKFNLFNKYKTIQVVVVLHLQF